MSCHSRLMCRPRTTAATGPAPTPRNAAAALWALAPMVHVSSTSSTGSPSSVVVRVGAGDVAGEDFARVGAHDADECQLRIAWLPADACLRSMSAGRVGLERIGDDVRRPWTIRTNEVRSEQSLRASAGYTAKQHAR